jgi:hypothetical protein
MVNHLFQKMEPEDDGIRDPTDAEHPLLLRLYFRPYAANIPFPHGQPISISKYITYFVKLKLLSGFKLCCLKRVEAGCGTGAEAEADVREHMT